MSTVRTNPTATQTQRPMQTVTIATQRPIPPRRTTTETLIMVCYFHWKENTKAFINFTINLQGRPAIIIDKYYVSRPSINPFAGILNTIGFKITTTADFITGMLRGTIQVIESITK